MAAAAILDFENVEILEVGRLKTANMRHRAKFRRDRSNLCWNMAIFRFFKMAAATILVIENVEILGARGLETAKMHHRNSVHYKEIGIKESNVDVRTLSGSS